MWRYSAYRLPSLELLHPDLPLTNVSFSQVLNGSGVFAADLPKASAFATVRISSQFGDVPVIEERGTLIVISSRLPTNTQSWYFIVDSTPEHDHGQDVVHITGAGPLSVLTNLPWMSAPFDGIDVDPMEVAYMLLDEAASYEDSIPVKPAARRKSPVRIGTSYPEDEVGLTEFNLKHAAILDRDNIPANETEEQRKAREEEETRLKEEQEKLQNEVQQKKDEAEELGVELGPRPQLSPWGTPDMMKILQDMAEECPFEYAESTVHPDSDGTPSLAITFAYPQLVRDAVTETVFQYGLNCSDPQTDETMAYASHVYVLGHGEGSTRYRGEAISKGHRRLRTVQVIEDTSIRSFRQCRMRAESVLGKIEDAHKVLERTSAGPAAKFINRFTVHDSDITRIHRLAVGQVVDFSGRFAWGDHYQTGRITTLEYNTQDNTCVVTVEPWLTDEE